MMSTDVSVSSPIVMVAPILGVQTSGLNKVLQVVGAALMDVGACAGQYIGPSGFVTDPSTAIAIQGATGSQGNTGAQGATGPSGAVSLGTATISESSLTTLALGVRRVTVAVTGVVTTGNYLAFPAAALTSGFGIVDAICTTNGQMTFGVLVPILTLGTYSISVRVYSIG